MAGGSVPPPIFHHWFYPLPVPSICTRKPQASVSRTYDAHVAILTLRLASHSPHQPEFRIFTRPYQIPSLLPKPICGGDIKYRQRDFQYTQDERNQSSKVGVKSYTRPTLVLIGANLGWSSGTWGPWGRAFLVLQPFRICLTKRRDGDADRDSQVY